MIDKDSQRQTCKTCNRKDKFNYHVDDDVWCAIIPPLLRDGVVFLYCFEEMADRSGVSYYDALRSLFFSDHKTIFEFAVKWGIE